MENESFWKTTIGKASLITIITALIGGLTGWLIHLNKTDPVDPVVTTTSSSSISSSSSTVQSSTTSVQVITAQFNLQGAKGEVVTMEFDHIDSSCITDTGPFPSQTYLMQKVTTQSPSYAGAVVGDYYDPMIEMTKLPSCMSGRYWTDIKIPLTATAGNYNFTVDNKSVQLKVLNWSMPTIPTIPLLIEMTSWYAFQGHYGTLSSKPWSQQGPLTDLYTKSLEDHRINPYKHYISTSDQTRILNASPYVVLPVLGTSPTTMTDSNLASMETLAKQAIAQNKKPIIYFWDEPSSSAITSMVPLVKNVKAKVPSAKIMVTTTFNQTLKNAGVDIFTPVMQHIGGSRPNASAYPELWTYVSCMSHGCANTQGNSGEPDLMLDRDPVYSRSFFWAGQAVGAKALLYFNSVEFFKSPSKDAMAEALWIGGGSIGGGWDFSGNGDGTLFYPNKIDNTPIVSLRLKMLRRGSFDMEYLAKAKAQGITVAPLATDWKIWDKNNINYDTEIKRLGALIQ